MNAPAETTHSTQQEFTTHEVFNQSPPLENYNLFTSDRALAEAVVCDDAAWAVESLSRFGARLGEPRVIALGNLANKYPSVLQTHNRYGRRRDEVEFHPA